jgi:hypothetical protein
METNKSSTILLYVIICGNFPCLIILVTYKRFIFEDYPKWDGWPSRGANNRIEPANLRHTTGASHLAISDPSFGGMPSRFGHVRFAAGNVTVSKLTWSLSWFKQWCVKCFRLSVIHGARSRIFTRAVPGTGSLLIRAKYASLCGSDFPFFRNLAERQRFHCSVRYEMCWGTNWAMCSSVAQCGIDGRNAAAPSHQGWNIMKLQTTAVLGHDQLDQLVWFEEKPYHDYVPIMITISWYPSLHRHLLLVHPYGRTGLGCRIQERNATLQATGIAMVSAATRCSPLPGW